MGKKRRCLVCGQAKKIYLGERICGDCQFLSAAERRNLRAKRKPRGSVWTVSGGLPSLGKRR
jgi:hypothetical protein